MFSKCQSNSLMTTLSKNIRIHNEKSLNYLNVLDKNEMKTAIRNYISTTYLNSIQNKNFTKNGNTPSKNNKDFQGIPKISGKHFSITPLNKTHVTEEQMKQLTVETSSKNVSIFKNPNVIIFFNKNETETIGQKIYRYLDITGFLTRYNNRKDWILDLDPYTRLSTVMLTEYERKLMIFLKFHVYLLFVICLYLWYHAQVHFTMKPPCPKPYAYGHLDGRKRDFTWHGRLFFLYPKMRCKDCRWLDVQCKKECFEKLKQEGHKFIINKGDPLSVPKTVLYPPHFH